MENKIIIVGMFDEDGSYPPCPNCDGGLCHPETCNCLCHGF